MLRISSVNKRRRERKVFRVDFEEAKKNFFLLFTPIMSEIFRHTKKNVLKVIFLPSLITFFFGGYFFSCCVSISPMPRRYDVGVNKAFNRLRFYGMKNDFEQNCELRRSRVFNDQIYIFPCLHLTIGKFSSISRSVSKVTLNWIPSLFYFFRCTATASWHVTEIKKLSIQSRATLKSAIRKNCKDISECPKERSKTLSKVFNRVV